MARRLASHSSWLMSPASSRSFTSSMRSRAVRPRTRREPRPAAVRSVLSASLALRRSSRRGGAASGAFTHTLLLRDAEPRGAGDHEMRLPLGAAAGPGGACVWAGALAWALLGGWTWCFA
eukprot:6200542-Pleurochrysis_carterae.AAC.4